jgi:hypothetical protein
MPGHPQNDGIATEVHLLGCRHRDLLLETKINELKFGIDPAAQDKLRNPLLGG